MKNKIAIFSPSHYCNSQCWMCTDLWTPIKKYLQPDFENICKDVLQLRDDGVNSIHISGGEPTVWKRFDDFISFISTLGFSSIAVYTNGRTLTKRKIEHCLENGVNLFLVSLHAADSLKGDLIANAPNSFKQTLNGLENLSYFKDKYSFEISISCVPCKLTETEIFDMVKLACNYNIDNFQLTYPVNTSLSNPIKNGIFPDLKVISPQLPVILSFLEERKVNTIINEIPPCYYKSHINYYSSAYNHQEERILIGYHTRNGKVHRDLYVPLEEAKMYFFTDQCDNCFVKSKCLGIPNVYKNQLVDGELNPFTYDEVLEIAKKNKKLMDSALPSS